MLNVEAAKEEILSKPFKVIQAETAYKWASRAAASYELVLTAADNDLMRLMIMASDFLGEAREHSSEVGPELLKAINDKVHPYMQAAWKHVDNKNGDKNV